MVSKKKTRVKKKVKANWRRADIKDIELFLDEERRNQSSGDVKDNPKSKSQRTDDELFVIHRKIKKAANEAGSRKVQFKKVDATASIEPIVKPITTVKKTKKQNPIRKAKLLLKEAKLTATNVVSGKKLAAIRKAASVWKPDTDIWNEKKKTFDNEYLAEADDYFQEQTCKKEIKVPTVRYVKSSALPAIEVPDAGASYKPTAEDYQKLLQKAHEIELKREKEEKHLDRVLTQMLPTKAEAPTQADWIKEMSQGLTVKNETEKNSSDSEVDEDSPLSCNPPTVRKPRLQAKRKRELRHKLIKKQLEKERLHRRQMHDILNVKSIVSEILEEEMKMEQRRQNRMLQSLKRKLQTQRLGNVKYENPEVEFLLPSERIQSLRRLRPQGSILQDRMKSLEKRNIIEPRLRQTMKRKYKLKRYVKNSHKE